MRDSFEIADVQFGKMGVCLEGKLNHRISIMITSHRSRKIFTSLRVILFSKLVGRVSRRNSYNVALNASSRFFDRISTEVTEIARNAACLIGGKYNSENLSEL